MENLKITNYEEGMSFNGLPFVVQQYRLGKTSSGDDFATVLLAQKEDVIEAKIWSINPDDPKYKALEKSSFALVSADINVYRGNKQLNISDVTAVDLNHPMIKENMSLLLERTHLDQDAVFKEIMDDINAWANVPLAVLVKNILEKHSKAFRTYPAAKFMHHDYYGGLLQHVWEMYQMVDGLPFPIDRELLKAGVLLHDIGKVLEYDVNEVFKVTDYSYRGNMLGHIIMGNNMILEEAQTLSIDSDVVDNLIHLVLSHHGEMEWGSPVTPKLKEAAILHYLDQISAKHEMIHKATKNLDKGEFSARNYNKGIQAGYTIT